MGSRRTWKKKGEIRPRRAKEGEIRARRGKRRGNYGQGKEGENMGSRRRKGRKEKTVKRRRGFKLKRK